MFPFIRRPNKRKPPPMPSWLKWLMLAFIGYAILISYSPIDNPAKRSVVKAQATLSEQKALHFSGYKDKIFPEYAAGLRIHDESEGTGMPAVCGQKVKIAYQAYLTQGNALPDTASKEKPLSFTIGQKHVMPVFDRGVIGMKAGGKRNVIAPPLMSYGLDDYKRDDVPAGASVRFEMELLSIEPTLPELETMPYRMAEIAVGSGNMLVCGDAAKLQVVLWDLSGKKLYETTKDAPLSITPGKAEVMLGLEQGIIGMLSGGRRLLIIPPAFQSTMHGEKPKVDFLLPKNQTVMAEVTAQ